MRIKNEKKLTYILLLMSIPSFAVSLERLNLVIPVTQLQENNATTLTVEGTYSNGETKPLSSGITWRISNPKVLETHGMNLIAKGEGTATIRAEVAGALSPESSITVYKVIYGHRLPPEPDPAINNSTLLGIDSNDNGVRDDVERWIYFTYDHPIERGLFMQSARAYQKVIVDPSKALETKIYLDSVGDCAAYWRYFAQENNESFYLERYRDIWQEIQTIQFNTIDRHMAYERYNATLSGGVYSAGGDRKEKCEFDENGFLRE